MADVTISQLTQGTPSGSNLLPYSTGSSTLGTPVSAIFQNTNSRIFINSTALANNTPGLQINNGTVFISNSDGNQVNISSGPQRWDLDVDTSADNAFRIRNMTYPAGVTSTALSITSAGYVTTPYQPIFRVSMTGGGGNQAAFIKVPFNYATVNVGGHYSLTDKQFNVPVDGNYHFTAGHMNSQNNSGAGTIEIRKNDVRQCYFHNSNSHPMSTSWSIILQCSKGDYINMYASHYHFGGAAESGYDYPTLMGYLIG